MSSCLYKIKEEKFIFKKKKVERDNMNSNNVSIKEARILGKIK